jgi:hypothetical protein
MKRFALVNQGIVENTIVALTTDDAIAVAEGKTVVEFTEENPVGVGNKFEETTTQTVIVAEEPVTE